MRYPSSCFKPNIPTIVTWQWDEFPCLDLTHLLKDDRKEVVWSSFISPEVAVWMKSVLAVAYGSAWALGASVFINESRTWEEMLPTRDGILLHTRVVLPRGDDGEKYPTIIDRSPYGYTDLEWIPDLFLPGGYATIGQDMRGTKLSEGRFSIWHTDANDSEDLGNWIVQQPWSNGEVYSFGASADGIAAFTTVNNSPSWLRNQYFIWTTSIGYPVFFPQGAMMGELVDSWIHGTVDGNWSEACYQNIKANEYYNGSNST